VLVEPVQFGEATAVVRLGLLGAFLGLGLLIALVKWIQAPKPKEKKA